VKAQSKEQNLLVASEREFQDEDWKKVEERTRLYTWAKALSEEPLTRVCNSAVTSRTFITNDGTYKRYKFSSLVCKDDY